MINWELFVQLFEDMWRKLPLIQSVLGEECAPPINLYEKEGKIILKAEVPGMKKEDIEVTLENNILSISGKKEPSREEKGISFYLKESPDGGAFCRSLELPGEVEADKVEASVKDGVLTVMMSKKTGPQPTKVEIKG
jgi:HSP20 family protein